MAALDLFNPSSGIKEENKNKDVYRVSYKDSKTGVYRSIIRFLPNPKDPMKSIMTKFVVWVKNPTTQKGMYIDDPTSIGQESSISSMYWALKNTGIATYVDCANNYLSGKRQYASLVQIMADEQHPELVGQIKVFVYGQKIYDKIKAEEEPQGAGQGFNPFHPYIGRKFSLVCTNQSNYNNFDQSGFFDERNGNQILPSGMWYIDPSNPSQYSIVNENTDGQVLLNYLLENAPDLSKYDFQPWTEVQSQHVNEVLTQIKCFLDTGSFSNRPQTSYAQPQGQPAMPQASFPGGQQMQPAYNPNPVFPGATMQPQTGGFVPQQSSAVPVANPIPNASAPVSSPIVPPVPQVQPQVSGVTPPVVSPQGSGNGSTPPPTGMNMDDILAQL